MTFVPVTALPCDSKGETTLTVKRVRFYLSKDMILSIHGRELYVKTGNVVAIGDNYFTGFEFESDFSIENL